MHGNLGASSTHSADYSLWFSEPAARELFDAATLSEADRERLGAHRSPRREQEFKVSRSLKAFTNAEARVYSLSHSAGHAALLLAPSGSHVGVDLEAMRPRDVLRIARFAFHEQEVHALEAAAERERDELFYVLWTLKEAVGKALQLNLLDALRQCVFRPGMNAWTARAPTQSPWSAQAFRVRPGLVLAAACVGVDSPPTLQQWDWPPQRAGDWPLIACATAPAGAGAPPV